MQSLLTLNRCDYRFEPGFGVDQMGAAVQEAIDWAEQHPVEVRKIVQSATAFASRYLNRDATDCYLMQVTQTATSANIVSHTTCLQPCKRQRT